MGAGSVVRGLPEPLLTNLRAMWRAAEPANEHELPFPGLTVFATGERGRGLAKKAGVRTSRRMLSKA